MARLVPINATTPIIRLTGAHVNGRATGPDPLAQIRPAELFTRFVWDEGQCLFCRRQAQVTRVVEVLWDRHKVTFEVCKACVFGIFTAVEHRLAGSAPPAYFHRNAS
jgi:hypothetical protein